MYLVLTPPCCPRSWLRLFGVKCDAHTLHRLLSAKLLNVREHVYAATIGCDESESTIRPLQQRSCFDHVSISNSQMRSGMMLARTGSERQP